MANVLLVYAGLAQAHPAANLTVKMISSPDVVNVAGKI